MIFGKNQIILKTDSFTQSYIVGIQEQYTGTKSVWNSETSTYDKIPTNYDIIINGNKMLIGATVSSNYYYVLIDDKCYVFKNTTFSSSCSEIAFELTDTSLTLGDTVYTFI